MRGGSFHPGKSRGLANAISKEPPEYAIRQLRECPFSSAPSREDLSVLHARLVDYDGFVAGLLARLQSGDLSSLPGGLIDRPLGAALRAAAEHPGLGSDAARPLLAYHEQIVVTLQSAGSD